MTFRRLLASTLLAALPALGAAFPGAGAARAEEGTAPRNPAVRETGGPGGSQYEREREEHPIAWRAADGRTLLAPTVLLMLDAGRYVADSGEPGLGGRSRFRHGKVGITGEPVKDLEYNVIWDFAVANTGGGGALYEAEVRYSGLKPVTLLGGAFELRGGLEDAQRITDILFLERSSMTEVKRAYGAGPGRVGAGLEAHGERWFAAGYATGGQTTTRGDDRARGAVARLAGLAWRSEEALLHVGASAGWILRGVRSGGVEEIELADYPELRVGAPTLATTGAVPADGGRSAGLELGGAWRGLWAQGEWNRFEVDRANAPTASFTAWYGQASYMLAGAPRAWLEKRGAWGRPRVKDDFDPARGQWGALEAGLRYSHLDLSEAGLRGGRQRIWTGGLNWYPTDRLKVAVQYQYGRLDRTADRTGDITPDDRRFQSVAVRTQYDF